MSNINMRIRQQSNAPSGRRAHPNHMKALADARKRERVRVEPTNEDQRHILRHPNGMAFRPEGSVEWPFDRFTQRRLRDGSVRIVEQADARKVKSKEKKAPARETSGV